VAGSGRTHGRTPLYDRLAPVARKFRAEFGGHHAALGLSVPFESFERFREEAREAFSSSRDDEEWVEELSVDTEASAAEVTPELQTALDRFEPHGHGNPRPLFLFPGLDWDGRGREVGERGLRLRLSDAERRIPLDAVGWTLGEIPSAERRGRFDVTANVALDTFTGRPSLTVLHLSRAAS
jgi:single-stranded-DNA-specific exonuclease